MIFAGHIGYEIGKEIGEVEGRTYPNPDGSERHWTEIELLRKHDQKYIFKRRVGGIFWWCLVMAFLCWYWWTDFNFLANDPNTKAYFYSNP